MPEKREGDKSKSSEKSRIARLKDVYGEDFQPPMPEIACGSHVLDHFWTVGPSLGDAALNHEELAFYQQNTGIELSPWECLTLVRMSREHMNEAFAATKRDHKAPHMSEFYEQQRLAQVGRDLEAQMDEVTG